MSVITCIELGAIPIKNLKIIGQTIKNAKLTPQKNKMIVEAISGAVKLFSFSYNPGDINIHIWINNHGIVNNKATYKTSFMGAMNGDATPVAIMEVPAGRVATSGSATKL